MADVHGAFDELARLVATGEPVVILGDLLNFVDYRTGDGIASDVFGAEFAGAATEFRRRGDFAGSRRLWRERSAGREDEVRGLVAGAIKSQYAAMRAALEGGSGLITHGNVDVPALLEAHVPDGFRYLNGEVVDIDGVRLGIIGGGSTTGLNAAGEISEDEMAGVLEIMGPVDVLGTHVPPAIDGLRRDVITGRLEGGSTAITEYLVHHQPEVHYFGDIHQPQASRWRVGRTRCINVGYFRATARAVRHG
ncbi:MAG: metallophosphoesterase [Acidimicrobiia bacterium]|nr:metallophosphoesterase [Acidimicrobiia bacterium]